MNKNNLNKLFFLIASISSFIISLILYIKSFELYQDEWGTDISFNNDYIVALIVSVLFIVYNITSFKTNKYNIHFKLTTFSIITLYSLGTFFKAISKGKAFITCSNYLFIGIVTIFITIGYILTFIKENKKH